ncbi:MAG: hypothetical protein CVU56_01235 [Deltaproteobacteria bacterium HGW-Deltaproteobacteria-14]|nr:MAG: hypothetical protein CVU56_01235 [Deltaproteobacteria bacterium HGW-Deltaproteobacteria-14]
MAIFGCVAAALGGLGFGCGGDDGVQVVEDAVSDTITAADTTTTPDDTTPGGDADGAATDSVAADTVAADTVVTEDTSATCSKPCDPHASCVAGQCVCDQGWTGSGFACEDVDECEDGTAVCGSAAACGNLPGTWTCVCPDGSEGQAISCDLSDCGCGWETTGCHLRTGALEVVALDLWARPVPGATVEVTSAAGEAVTFDGGLAALCGNGAFTLRVGAPDHHDVTQTLSYAGPSSPDALTAQGAMPFGGGVVITRGTRTVAGEPVEVTTVWAGLAHRWFAASARPWHPDTLVELLMNGETTWKRVTEDLRAASQLITISIWWWRSDFELLRGTPSESVNLGASARRQNTVMAILEASPAAKKVLVNQFFSQDGLLANFNVDDALIAKGEATGDGFEFMGHANEAAGTFDVAPAAPDFGAALAEARPDAAAAQWLDENPPEAFIPTQVVDMTDLPLGLGSFDIPLASWHQKFLTMDQDVAYIGGMNFNLADWDTDEHLVFDPRRMPFDASRADRQAVLDKEDEPQAPRTDFHTRIEGAAVRDAVDVFHQRWAHQRAAGVRFADRSTDFTVAPADPGVPGGVPLQVVATMPAPFDEYAILETLVRAIGQAEHYIFIEDQYMRAPILGDAIIDRMAEVPALQLIVFTNAIGEWSDPGCWQTYLENEAFESLWPDRYGLFQLRSYASVDTDCTFCWDEVDAHFVAHDLHAKLVIIDDVYLEVGSCNHNNRGLLYEGELAIAVHDAAWVEAQRHRVFGNLIGPAYSPTVGAEDVLQAFRTAAAFNQAAYDEWDDEGFDLDLDGHPVPAKYIPSGFVYPMSFPEPTECFLESIGADVT